MLHIFVSIISLIVLATSSPGSTYTVTNTKDRGPSRLPEVSMLANPLTTGKARAQECNQWDVSGNWKLIQGGVAVYVKLTHSGRMIGGTAWWWKTIRNSNIWLIVQQGDDVKSYDGTVDGTLDGNRFSVQIYWKDGSIGVYTGEIGPSGRINGSTYDRNRPNNRAEWYTEGVMKCSPSSTVRKSTTGVIGKRRPKEERRNDPEPLRPAVAKNDGIGAALGIRRADPATCKSGFVWREATHGDRVCVSPESRQRVRIENRTADSRREPGSAKCKEGFVWREAFPGDTICVTPAVRSTVREENRLAGSRTNRL